MPYWKVHIKVYALLYVFVNNNKMYAFDHPLFLVSTSNLLGGHNETYSIYIQMYILYSIMYYYNYISYRHCMGSVCE